MQVESGDSHARDAEGYDQQPERAGVHGFAARPNRIQIVCRQVRRRVCCVLDLIMVSVRVVVVVVVVVVVGRW